MLYSVENYICSCRYSELRAVELLDGLCGATGVGQYAFVQFNISASGKTTSQWKKIHGQEVDALVNGTR
jgi:hypothetical protein